MGGVSFAGQTGTVSVELFSWDIKETSVRRGAMDFVFKFVVQLNEIRRSQGRGVLVDRRSFSVSTRIFGVSVRPSGVRPSVRPCVRSKMSPKLFTKIVL